MDVAGQERLSPSPPERRYLTIMFIDMVGYTELSEQLEPEDLLALLNRYQQLAPIVMERFGGFVASFSGDGVLVYSAIRPRTAMTRSARCGPRSR
jgi:class 3 adenylate cyclase